MTVNDATSRNDETAASIQFLRLRFRTINCIFFAVLALALLTVPVAGVIMSNNRGGGQTGNVILISSLILGPGIVWFGYFASRGLLHRGCPLDVNKDGLTGSLLPNNRSIAWSEISNVELRTQGGYERLTLTLFSGEQITIRDIHTLSPSLGKAFQLIKNRLETGVLAFPVKGPWWMSETVIVLGGLALSLICLAALVAIVKSWK